MSLASIIPVVGLVVPGTVSAFCLIVGLRCALAARGYANEPDFGQLLRVSLVFCIINIIATYLIELVAGLGFRGIMLALTETGAMSDGAPGSALLWLGGGTLLVYSILLALYASAIAVPMTSAAAAASTKGYGDGAFFGFGVGLFSLTVVMLVWVFGGHIFAIFGEVWTMFAMVASALFALASGNEIPWRWSGSLTSLMGGTLFMTWASSWFFATAVLAWEKAGERRKAAASAATSVQRVSSTDIRALREQRSRSDAS